MPDGGRVGLIRFQAGRSVQRAGPSTMDLARRYRNTHLAESG